jgi:XRE family transcriptional regulator, regulator of sulfur utilization
MPPRRSPEAKLSEKLKARRQQVGLSVRSLAQKTGFSPSFISQLELAQVSPSLASLGKIADALGVGLGELLADNLSQPTPVVLRAGGTHLRSAWSKASLRPLTPPDASLEAVLLRLEPGGRSGATPVVPSRRRLAYCIRGAVRMEHDRGSTTLKAGDSVLLIGPETVGWENTSRAASELLLVTVFGA